MTPSSDIPPSTGAAAARNRLRGAAVMIALVVLMLFSAPAAAQPSAELAGALAMLESGNAPAVQEMLPQLIPQNQNSPEMLYLQARLEPDGIDAIKLYESILENFPSSGCADDALYYLYQYDVANGLYQSAGASLKRLKADYPASPLIAAVDEVVVPQAEPEKPASVVASRGEGRQSNSDARPAKRPALEDRSGPETPAASGRYALQVGAFSTTANAEKQKNFFENLGYHVEISNRVMAKKGLYLVWVGAYRTAEEAKRESAKIKSKHKIASMVIER